MKDLLPEVDRRALLKDKLLRTGEVVLIDHVEAEIDLKNGQPLGQSRRDRRRPGAPIPAPLRNNTRAATGRSVGHGQNEYTARRLTPTTPMNCSLSPLPGRTARPGRLPHRARFTTTNGLA